ncbi:MAG: sulfate reduction electron transfer complex DsrMKJOP subunit DsrO [Pseudomonadota bacterium]
MSADAKLGISRRGFLAVSAATLGGVVLAPGVRLIEIADARAPEQAVSTKVRWGLLIDTNKCPPGCDDCVKACAIENAIKATGHARTDPQWIRKVQLKDKRTGHTQAVPVMCQHCEHPPCVDVCPTGASFKRADGIVLVDRHICIGCRYCMMACPYKARSIVFEEVTGQNPDVPRGKGCAEACTLCVHRVDRDLQPACVEACARAGHNAMIFGDLNNAQSEIAQRIAKYASTQIRADLRLNPGVRYQGL